MKREYDKIEIADQVYIDYGNAIKLAIQNPQKNWKKQITECLNKGIDINYGIGKYGETALIFAVKHYQEKLFKFSIKNGANVNTCDDNGFTPLHFNTVKLKNNEKFDISMFEELLKRGANLHAQTTTTQETPLYWIAKFGTANLMKLAIQSGANIHEKDAVGCTPLAHAILNKKYDSIKILGEAGALLIDIDDLTGGSAFHLAIGLSKKNIENIMIHAGFDYFKEVYPEQKQKMNEIIEAVLVFNQIGIPKEIIFSILSKLLPEYFINEKFCQYLLYKGYKLPYIFYQTNKRVMCLKDILQGNINYKRQTAAEFLLIEQNHAPQYIDKVKNLLNGNQLTEDMEAFRLAFPEKINKLKQNNLALRICKNIEEKIGI